MKKSVGASERWLWMSATVILLLLALFAVNHARNEAQTARAARKISVRKKEQLLLQVETLQREFLTDDDIKALQNRGLRNPLADLRADLSKQGKLIPFPPVLGGKMGFYDRDAIRILNRRWAIAAFDDGHISGQALLKYEVKAGGQISWRIIEAIMD